MTPQKKMLLSDYVAMRLKEISPEGPLLSDDLQHLIATDHWPRARKVMRWHLFAVACAICLLVPAVWYFDRTFLEPAPVSGWPLVIAVLLAIPILIYGFLQSQEKPYTESWYLDQTKSELDRKKMARLQEVLQSLENGTLKCVHHGYGGKEEEVSTDLFRRKNALNFLFPDKRNYSLVWSGWWHREGDFYVVVPMEVSQTDNAPSFVKLVAPRATESIGKFLYECNDDRLFQRALKLAREHRPDLEQYYYALELLRQKRLDTEKKRKSKVVVPRNWKGLAVQDVSSNTSVRLSKSNLDKMIGKNGYVTVEPVLMEIAPLVPIGTN